MATFEQHNIQLVDAGATIKTEYDGKLRRLQKMFVCPYKDTVKCPRTDLFHEDNVFVPGPECNMSPAIFKRNGQSVCNIVVDLSEPTLMETLNRLGDLIEFRNEKGEIKMSDLGDMKDGYKPIPDCAYSHDDNLKGLLMCSKWGGPDTCIGYVNCSEYRPKGEEKPLSSIHLPKCKHRALYRPEYCGGPCATDEGFKCVGETRCLHYEEGDEKKEMASNFDVIHKPSAHSCKYAKFLSGSADFQCTHPDVELCDPGEVSLCIGPINCAKYSMSLDVNVANEPNERTSKYDVVSKPSHYTEGRKYEPKDVIRDWGLNFNLGNTVKYVARAGRKDDILQDLKKARQYLDFEIEYLEKEREEK